MLQRRVKRAPKRRLKELFDNTDECPLCHEKRARIGDAFVLKYTTCCGSALCVPCISKKIHSKKMRCLDCDTLLKKMDWTFDNLDRQRYLSTAQTQQRLMGSYVMTLRNFKDATAYHDHLEEVQDVAYQLVYGSKDEQAEARERKKAIVARVNAYAREHRDKVINMNGDIAFTAANQIRRSHKDNDEHHPDASMHFAPLRTIKRDWNGPTPSDAERKELKYVRLQLEVDAMPAGAKKDRKQAKVTRLRNAGEAIKVRASGFVKAYDIDRNTQESWAALDFL